MTKRTPLGLLLLGALLLASCEFDPVGLGDQGEVRFVALGDGTVASANLVPLSFTVSPALAALEDVRGTVTFRPRITFTTSDGQEFLAADGAPASVRIAGGESVVGSARLGPATVTNVRVEFTGVEAEIDRGSLSDGIQLGRSFVAGPVTRSVEVNFGIEGGVQQTVEIDLRALTWLPAAQGSGREVPPESFRSAVRISVR